MDPVGAAVARERCAAVFMGTAENALSEPPGGSQWNIVVLADV